MNFEEVRDKGYENVIILEEDFYFLPNNITAFEDSYVTSGIAGVL